MSYVFKIAKSGSDAKTASDKDLVFSSEFKTMKDAFQAEVSQVVGATTYETKTVAHGLGITPDIKVFYDNNDGVWHPVGAVTNFAGPVYEEALAYSDSTNIYIDCFNGDASPKTFNIKIFAFKNKR